MNLKTIAAASGLALGLASVALLIALAAYREWHLLVSDLEHVIEPGLPIIKENDHAQPGD